MVIITLRSLIIFSLLVFFVRLMGKRTIGELQPYEFVITLALADLACIPIQDSNISILYGLIPLTVLFLAHYFLTLLTAKSVKARLNINGRPITLIDPDGINTDSLKKLNLNVNDVLGMIRQQGYFCISEILYALIETNGKISIMANPDAVKPNDLPISLIVDGRLMTNNFELINFNTDKVRKILEENNLIQKDVILMAKEGKRLFIQPVGKKYILKELS